MCLIIKYADIDDFLLYKTSLEIIASEIGLEEFKFSKNIQNIVAKEKAKFMII